MPREFEDVLKHGLLGDSAAGDRVLLTNSKIGAAGVEIAEAVLSETQQAFLPLVTYLDSLRWVSIATALAGIGIAIYTRIDDWQAGRR